MQPAGQIATQYQEIYGLCLFQPAAGLVEVFVNDKSGLIEQYQLSSDGKRWQGRENVRRLQVPGQPEGCVVDDERQQLFVGEEDAGIWRFAAAATASSDGKKSFWLMARRWWRMWKVWLLHRVSGRIVGVQPGQ